ncbi:MAG: hypothetical protein QXW77_00830 [Candidatus Hadarchaeales archaeon]
MYWAEIKPEGITFYIEEELELVGLLTELKKMRRNWRQYQQLVVLDSEQVNALESEGIRVLLKRFRALRGIWHWFTGWMSGDAFRLSPKIEGLLRERGFFEVKFVTGRNVIVKLDALDPNEFDLNKALFVVSCTKRKFGSAIRRLRIMSQPDVPAEVKAF